MTVGFLRSPAAETPTHAAFRLNSGRASLLVVGAFLTLFGNGCIEPTSITIAYVIPSGYRGAFLIYTSQEGGAVVRRDGSTYTFVIPESGILRIQGLGPFSRWHYSRAWFQDGTPLPVGYMGSNRLSAPTASPSGEFPDDVVALWDGGARVINGPAKKTANGWERQSVPGAIQDWFVGTKKEAKAFFHETADKEIKVGGVPQKAEETKEQKGRGSRS